IKDWIVDRKNNVMSNAEVNVIGLMISDVSYFSQGIQWQQPGAMQPASVISRVSSTFGIDQVSLYFATGIVGNFEKITMMDDGLHNDSASGDGIYGAEIPGMPGGQWVRYYIEATAANTARTVTYMPAGAEHNVFVYLIIPGMASDTSVVINEVMASNTTTATDSSGQFDDWIELFNTSGNAVDLSGYFLTDNDYNFIKWEFPAGTIIPPNDYLIVWADEDATQAGLHCNFKLSSAGEHLLLLNPNRDIVDEVTFGQQVTDQGYARVPNGTGNFVIQMPTISYNNNLSTDLISISSPVNGISLAPNPANDQVRINVSQIDNSLIELMDNTGRVVLRQNFKESTILNTSELATGMYFVRCGPASTRLVVQH
ncbi:MAG: lamin tail domain-containing protein, partial [Bacteroidia bacterium]|nr:lamin tail domain-containing protein [Bacteroidia bacterium]